MTMAKDQLVRLLGSHDHALNYEQARDLLDHPDSDVRLALANRSDLEPEILYFLARDPDIIVRRAVTVNPNTPEKAHLLLAEDSASEVRSDLADRLGQLLPDLTEDEKDKAWRTTHQALTLLARDQLPLVRRVLSETLKLLPTAPHDIILTLAHDRDSDVAAPVLQFSPVLTDEDLLSVIASSPLSASLSAISKRYGVSFAVSDAIYHTGDTSAVTALLGNESAQIREETLDAIVSAAPGHTSWHEPLVRRRDIAPETALHIAGFVADSLIENLAARDDFPKETISHLKDIVRNKLRDDQQNERLLPPNPSEGMGDYESLALAEQQVETLAGQGQLTAEQVLSALDDENISFAIVAVAQLAGISMQAVTAAVNSNSAKAIQALSWKAGFSAEDAVHLQMALGRVPPNEIITPRSDGSYDATTSEMMWQVELFMEEARNG
ncbi:MAG: DUF2336 domain-containing protein [Rhodospirillaceae bacterium]